MAIIGSSLDGNASFGTELLDVKSWTVSSDAEVPDYAGSDTAGWTQAVGGVSEWSAAVVVVANTSAHISSQASPGTSATLILTESAGDTYTGTAVVESYETTVDIEGEVISVTLGFQGSGQLVFAAS